MKRDENTFAITSDKNTKWYFAKIVYETTLKNVYDIKISYINKHKLRAEEVMSMLKMVGWELDKKLEKNPSTENIKGDNTIFTIIIYHLILNPTIISIQDEVLKDKRAKEILLYLLNNILSDNIKYNELVTEFEHDEKIKDFILKVASILDKKPNAPS